jgi:glycosyltransferase involved in cell wall biosynthesis
MKLAIIDIIGAPYDGSTPFKQGLGGSESAVVLMARELQKLGANVTVFCNCNIDHAKPGKYDNVEYVPLEHLSLQLQFDVIISSRTVIPFTDPKDFPLLNDNRSYRFADYNLYERLVSKAKVRALWMHDTFSLGDGMLEDLAISDRITDIFTLSDFHLTYVTNCAHGRKRNFEVLKRKMFITRNGATNYNLPVDITKKDKDLFVYNASVSKGMTSLVNNVWPLVKQRIPSAKLKVLGGFYKFQSNTQPDKQEEDWRAMAINPINKQLDIDFTGIITQKEVAQILTEANFMIYPATFPETYGISTLESMLYNVPVLTCRFGALEEVAIDEACYKIDYPIEPNGLFPEINNSTQIVKFVEMVIKAYNDPYLHQQKQYYCNIIKPIVGWDTVALQWKQFLYKKLGLYLPTKEYKQVTNINHKVNRIYKRRYHNLVELSSRTSLVEQPIVVISTFYNCQNYIEQCIESIATQYYDNYRCILIDDCSTDDTLDVARECLDKLPDEVRRKFTLICQASNVGAVRNQIKAIRSLEGDPIVIILDGDDSLINDNTVFSYYNDIYDGSTEFTYGSCWSLADRIPLISQPYPDDIKQQRAYRKCKFNWGIPYTHLRTFNKHLIDRVDDSLFQDQQGNWFKAGGDGAVFYGLIEAADPDKVKCIQDIVYNYNDMNPLNDYKVNADQQNKAAKEIANKDIIKKKILIAIPTARNIEAETFKSIYDLETPEGCELTFQYFYGYNVDQVRNLIADWVINGFDYLFSVDSDISFPPDTLKRLISHDKDVVSGLYVQRKPGVHILEVYEPNNIGGVTNIDYEKLKGRGLVEIASCGFGCVLVKSEVMRIIGYPQFQYHSAISHANTISEDVDFCRKALAKGFKIWADTSVLCNHTGSWTFQVGK